jgi:hypothetical protein
VIEWLEFGPSILGKAGKQFHFLFGISKLCVTLPEKPDPTFISCKCIFEAGGAIFQFAED